MTTVSINIPFCGFYDSLYSREVDHIERNDAEYTAEYRQEEEGIPEPLRLDADEVSSILFDVTDYSAAYAQLAKDYVPAFDAVLGEAIGIKLGLVYEELTSPREYNFDTDRIFVTAPLDTMRALFAQSASESHTRLAHTIAGPFTSRSGFISFYPNALSSWLAKPLEDWDHNELGTLLLALMPDRDDWEMSVYYRVTESEGAYSAWSNAVDWEAYEAKVAELRADKAAELATDDPDFVMPPYRCPDTPDLFNPKA